LLPTGTHGVPVDAPGLDLGAATPFQGLVDAEDQGTIAAVEVLKQQQEQNAGCLTGRPHRSVQHLVVAGEVVLVAAAHDPERGSHGALTRG